MPDKIKEVYELISDKGYFTDENEFRSFVTDPKKRNEAYQLIKDDGFFTDENEFNSYFEPEKKKFGVEDFNKKYGTSYTPAEFGAKSTSQLKSPSTSTTTTTTTPKTDKPIQLQQRPKSSTPDFVSPQEITRQLTELGQAPYDEVKERNRIQNYSQGLKKAQVKASQQLIQRDELLAQVEQSKLALEQAKADPQAYNALVPQYNELLKQVNQVTDNIKGEIAKIDIYEKGIGATQLKRTMNEDTGDARWQAGVNEAKQIMLQTLPTTARYMGYFAARTKGIPADMAEKVSTDFVEQNFGGLLDTARELAAENEDLQEVFTKESAWEALKEGDVAKTADLASKELMQTLPATLALMASYVNPALGATTTIMGTAGTELESMEDENMSPDAKMANALVKGGLEYATEKIFGTIPMVKRAIGSKNKAGQEALQNVMLETWNKYAKKMGFGADVIEEVGSEMLNTIGGNYTDYLTGKTDDLQLLKDIGKTFTTSLTMAALLSGGARAIKYSNKEIDKLREDTKKLKEIAASQETTPEVLEVIQENIVKNNEKIGDEAEKEKKVFDSMTEEEWDEATALIQENQSLQEQIEAGEVQPEVLPIVEKKIEENTAQVEAIKEDVKLTLEQRIEALNKLKKQDNATQEGNIEQSNITEREGVTEQQQGEQENRVNQEEPIATAEAETSGGNRIIEGGQEQTQEVKPINNPLKLNSEEIGLAEMANKKPSEQYSVRQFFSKKYDDIAIPAIGTPKFEEFLEENKLNTKETEVLISEITPTQALLDKKGIGGKLTEGNPIAVRFKGSKKIYLLDGHHRTSTEVAKGNKKIKLDLIDIDKTLNEYEDSKVQEFLNELEAKDKKEVEAQEPILSESTPSESKTKRFSLNNLDTFYHASNTKRKGRLRPSTAEGFGEGIYFSTNKDLVKGEFGDNVTEVKLNISNPLYTSTEEYYKVLEEAIATADKEYGKKRGLTLEEGQTYFQYDPTNYSEIYEIDSTYLSDAAKKLGYDAIIDKGSKSYDNEILVLDESKIIYPEDEKTNQKEDGERMLGRPQANRSKEQGGEASPELYSDKEKEVKPIRQLGSGSNVYFETDKYRVNESKDGGFLLNIQNQKDPVAIANIKFDNASDAVTIAKEVNRIYPNGVPDAVIIDKFIDGLKKELLGGKKATEGFNFENLFKKEQAKTPEQKEAERVEDIEQEREAAYQKSGFDKKWAKTYKEAKQKLADQYNKAKAEKEKAESKSYKSAGTKSVFVGGELEGNFVSVNAINERKRQNAIKNAQSDMDSAKKDLKSLGLSQEEIDALLSEKEATQEVKPKSKPKRVGPKKAINKLDPQTKRDYIALALFNNPISIDSFNNANDRNNLKVEKGKFPAVRMNYLRKNGKSIYQLVDDLMRDKQLFPFEVTEEDLLNEITGFMLDNPNGPNAYAVEMLNTPDPEQEYFDMKFAEYEQQLKEEKLLEEAIFEELELAWDKIESDVDALTEAEIAEIEQLMATDQEELINQVIEKNNENIRAEERKNQAVSKGESGTKSDKGKERASLEEEVTDYPTLEDVKKNPENFRIIKSFDAKFARSFGVQDGKPYVNKVNLASGVREYSDYPISNESNRPIRYVMMLADKSNYEKYFIMSYDGYIRLTKPEWWDKIKEYKAKDYRQQILIFELLPQEEQEAFINSLISNPDNYSLDGSFDAKKAFTDTPFDMLANLTSEAYEKFTKKELGEKKVSLGSRVAFEAGKISDKFNFKEKLPFGVKGYSTDPQYKSEAWYNEFNRLVPKEKQVEATKQQATNSKQILEEEVKKAKSKVDSANVALSKAKSKMASAAAEYQKDIFGGAKIEGKLFSPDLKAIKKEIEQKEIDLAKAKEAQEKAIAKLDAFVEENQRQLDFTEKAIEALNNLKVDTKNKGFDAVLGIPIGIWNATLDTIIGGLRAGRAINELVQEAIEKLKEYKGFDQNAFKQYLIEGGVATKEELEGVEAQVEEVTDNEVPPIEPPKPPKGEKGEGMTPSEGMEISKHYKTIMANTTLDELTKGLEQIDFEYKPTSMESDREVAMAYLQKNGIERSLLNLTSRNIEGLTKSEEVQLAALLYASLNKAMREAIIAGNMELANAIFKEARPLTKITRGLGTDYGRAVNAFKAFALDFSDPVTAAFNLEKFVEEANQKAMKSEGNKTNAESTAKTINNDIKKGKKKTVKEVVKTLNDELYGQITKGGKGLTTEQKAKIKNVFEAFKVKSTNTQSTIFPVKESVAAIVGVKNYNDFVEKVGDLVAEGASLSLAILEVSKDMLRQKLMTPQQLTEARKALNEQVKGLKEKKPLTKAQEERKAASEELKEEVKKFNAEKELADYKEKQEKKIQSLREKEAKKVLDAVEKLELQRSQQAAKEAAQLEEELAKERKRIADLKAKEETDRQDRMAKMELQRAQQALKETEKAIKELTSEIQKTDEELVNEILDEYLSLEGDVKTNNQKLIDMVKEKLGVGDAQAKVIATKIAKGVAQNIKAKLETKFGNQLSEEEKAAKKAGAKPRPNPLDDLIRAGNLGITPELVMDFFKNKYGIKEVTVDDIQAIQELAKAVSQAPTKSRKGVLLGKIQDIIESKKNKTLAELLNNLWHARVLSPVISGIFGTGDVNLTYNLYTLYLNTIEYPLTLGVSFVKELGTEISKQVKGKKINKKELKEISKGLVSDLFIGGLKGFGQTLVYDEETKTNAKKFLSILTNSKYMSQALSYLKTSVQEGSSFKKEYDNPFKATAGARFDLAYYNDLFKRAENGDANAKQKIVQSIRTAVNLYVNSVSNILSGQDLFFNAILSNTYSVPLLREQLRKEGLSREEVNKEMYKRLLNTKVEYDNARRMAVKNRMQYDITFEMKINEAGQPVWIIKDKGKEVKEGFYPNKKVKQFESKQDAIDYAVENVAPKGNTFNNDIIDILNEKLGADVQAQMDKISQNELLSGDTEGGTRRLLALANNIIAGLEDTSKFLSEASKAIDAYDWSTIAKMTKDLDPSAISQIVKKTIAGLIDFISINIFALKNILAYLRVGLNALRNQSNYLGLGLLRYFMSFLETEKGMSRGLTGPLSYKISETERNKLLAKAILGAYFTYVAGYLPYLITFDDDEEEEKQAKKRFLNWYKENTGEELKGEQKNFFLNLKKGQAIGSLEWMSPAKQKFYRRTGLLIENSVFEGYDKDGKPIYNTTKNKPQYAGSSMISTYQLIKTFGDEDERKGLTPYVNAAQTPLLQWKDMSIGQGGITLLFGNLPIEDKAKKIAQLAILDNFEVLNPSLGRVLLQVADTKMRRNDDLFTALENEATIAGGVKRWMFNRIIPVYASYNQAMKAPQIYGMFGEELYRIPAESQGLVGSTIAKYINSGKNIEEKNMYIFLDNNGYGKIWEWNKEMPVFTEGAEPKTLTRDEIDKYGMMAGRKTLSDMKKNMVKLDAIRNNPLVSDEEAQKDFNRYVDMIFRQNFLESYYESNNTFKGNTEEVIQNANTKLQRKIDEEVDAIQKELDKNTEPLSEQDLELKKAFRNNDSVIKYFSNYESMAELDKELTRVRRLGLITKEQFNDVKNIFLQ
jgi:hypothetical protein